MSPYLGPIYQESGPDCALVVEPGVDFYRVGAALPDARMEAATYQVDP